MCLQTILFLPKIWRRNDQSCENKWGELVKKRPNIYSNHIFKKIVVKDPFKKDDVEQKQFLEDLGFLIVKKIYPCSL